jgi:hypothetical protein
LETAPCVASSGRPGANPNSRPPPPLLPFSLPSSLPEAAAGQSRATPVKGGGGDLVLGSQRDGFGGRPPCWDPAVVRGARLARPALRGYWQACWRRDCVPCIGGVRARSPMGLSGPYPQVLLCLRATAAAAAPSPTSTGLLPGDVPAPSLM